MKRHVITPRDNWKTKAEEIGFTYHTSGEPSSSGDGTYWDESIAYEFSLDEVEEIESATEEVHMRCLDVVDKVVNDPDLLNKIQIPPEFHKAIKRSWAQDDPSLYGRFDFAYNGKTPPKMLEYNADTPTMVIETALMQWFWLQDVKPGKDQFNSLHEKLIDQFGVIKTRVSPGNKFYIAGYEDNLEEHQTCRYFQDLAIQAGLNCDFINLGDIGWNGYDFTDVNEDVIRYWFKLYPWEWMMDDDFGDNVIRNSSGIVEPIWKSVLSNKGILPILHETFPNHPNILPASFTNDLPVDDLEWFDFQSNASTEELESFSRGEINPGNYIVKPMLSREGANIDLVQKGKVVVKTSGQYVGPRIYQKTADLFTSDSHRAVIGSWVVGNSAAGMIIRDHDQEIVRDTSKVVPHWID